MPGGVGPPGPTSLFPFTGAPAISLDGFLSAVHAHFQGSENFHKGKLLPRATAYSDQVRLAMALILAHFLVSQLDGLSYGQVEDIEYGRVPRLPNTFNIEVLANYNNCEAVEDALATCHTVPPAESI